MASEKGNPKRPSSTGSRARGNLSAAGAAAVLVVYSAGFAKTKSAADRFASEDARRGATAVSSVENVALSDSSHSITTPLAADVVSATRTSVPQPAASAHTVSHSNTSVRSSAPKTTTSRVAQASPSTVVSSSESEPAPPPSPAPVIASAPAPVVADDPTPDTAKTTARTAKYKDGIFLGWGSSRHGDIQASVEIRNGVIIAATIVQCRTQYSCSRIDSLPPEVVARQSAEIDYVSRATQSSNAFYYAIVNALSQAK